MGRAFFRVLLIAGSAWLAGQFGVSPALGQVVGASAGAAAFQLALIDSHYQRREMFRAETEVLRFLNDHPGHAAAGEVELLRAKLFYREGRYGESSLMLFSHLDRYRRDPSRYAAAQMLVLSLVREGRLDEAEPYLDALREPDGAGSSRGAVPSLEPLKVPLPEAVDLDKAVLWSTFLPGAGFFTLGEPGKAFAGLGLNLLFTAAAVVSFEEEQPVAGLLFLIAEIALYRGGREAVHDAAQVRLAAAEAGRRGVWANRQGEGRLLGVGLRMKFGGS